MTTHTCPLLIAKEAEVTELRAKIEILKYGAFGVLTAPAFKMAVCEFSTTRLLLPPFSGLCDVIGFDFRKIHEHNDTHGFDETTDYVRSIVATRSGRDGRIADIVGQIASGDEFGIVTAPGCGRIALKRFHDRVEQVNAELRPAIRAELSRKTGGLIDGFALAAVLIERTHDPLAAIMRANQGTIRLKGGNATGERATSGVGGFVYARMAA